MCWMGADSVVSVNDPANANRQHHIGHDGQDSAHQPAHGALLRRALWRPSGRIFVPGLVYHDLSIGAGWRKNKEDIDDSGHSHTRTMKPNAYEILKIG